MHIVRMCVLYVHMYVYVIICAHFYPRIRILYKFCLIFNATWRLRTGLLMDPAEFNQNDRGYDFAGCSS